MDYWHDRVALVTGGSRGIGEMIAEGFVVNGVKTYISSRKAEVCDATAARLSEQGECISIPADLSTMDGVSYIANEIRAREPQLDLLVTAERLDDGIKDGVDDDLCMLLGQV